MDDAFKKKLYKKGHGFRCPCCDQHCQMYKRKLHAQMAIFLIVLVRRVGLTGKYLHVRDIISAAPGGKNSTDGTYLVHWKLIQRPPRLPGHYQPTALGVDFANADAKVPKYIYLYDNKLMYSSPEETNILDALGSKFNYQELMYPETSTTGEKKKPHPAFRYVLSEAAAGIDMGEVLRQTFDDPL